ncbi:TetR/AcrR family transcriptional regulator [Leifsonia poae]|uniref:TetR family transcriptional regulator n=1 Tax=Leifsonia poae TaxID=110933 RepID=A0A9W6H9L6_9MICO|nr:TetR family transcriptional regulator [Leifsonia poae]GLJ75882.1 TetR family transcriptional regulator [Leifsonia poae]
MATNSRSTLSTAEARRETVIASAIEVFGKTGYLGTPIAAVATHADISTAYVFKLFPGKESLFVAALERCFDLIEQALETGAEAGTDHTPDGILDAMGDAYADLIGDRSLLMLQVHAQSAADVPEIGEALRHGLARVTRFAKSRSGASDDAVQRFIAFGQLCHLIVTTGIDGETADWARLLTAGIRHP